MSERVDAGGGRLRDSEPPVVSAGGWDPPADLAYGEKLELLRSYLQASGLRTMVETGLYNGRGSGMELADLLDTYYIIDVSEEQIVAAIKQGYTDVWTGDSGVLMPGVLASLHKPAFFWLDAHLVSTEDEPNASPLLAELAAIVAWPHATTSTVLIDDVRLMARKGWPSLEQVLAVCESVWSCTVARDVLRCVPREGVMQVHV